MPQPLSSDGSCCRAHQGRSHRSRGSDEYKQAVIDAIKTEGPSVVGITSESGYTFDEHNNPIKSAVIMTVTGGVETYKEMY